MSSMWKAPKKPKVTTRNNEVVAIEKILRIMEDASVNYEMSLHGWERVLDFCVKYKFTKDHDCLIKKGNKLEDFVRN